MSDWPFPFHSDTLAVLSHSGSFLIHLAQTFEDNLGREVSDALNNFIESGQVWALGIGFILGYIVRSFTAY